LGLATSKSPYGPWTKHPHNPIITTNHYNRSAWNGVRVDNPRPLISGGVPKLFLKGLSLLDPYREPPFTIFDCAALPNLLFPSINISSIWNPPYNAYKHNPIIRVDQSDAINGFENYEFFSGPDRLLHMIGSDHGGCTPPNCNPHYVSADHGYTWTYIERLALKGEPAPAYEGGPPSDRVAVRFFVMFLPGKDGVFQIGLFRIQWSKPSYELWDNRLELQLQHESKKLGKSRIDVKMEIS